MSILLNPWTNPDEWLAEFEGLLPDETIELWPECADRDGVEMLVAWQMRRTDLATFTNLHTILSMGAGTEQWQKEGSPDVRIVRLADPAMSDEMAAYALHWVIHLQRSFDTRWGAEHLDDWHGASGTFPTPAEHRVGILGFGTIGRRIGRAFTDLGYPISAWSRRGTDETGVTSHAGLDELEAFLGSCRAVINVLPNTAATRGLLTADRFAQFADGAVFVNIGRGSVVEREADMVSAIDQGPLSAVVLDVTSPEPPAPDSPLLGHPSVHLTPHIAGSTQMASAAKLIAANIERIRRGEDPYPVVDRESGY